MSIKYADAVKDPKVMALLKAFMIKEHNAENYDFLTSTEGNDKLYQRFIDPNSATQVNLPGSIQKPLEALAAQQQWAAMASQISAARANITALINNDTLTRFVNSPAYVEYLASKGPKPPAVPPAPPKAAAKPPAPPPPPVVKPAPPKPAAPVAKVEAAPDLGQAKAAVVKMEVDIAAGATFFNTAITTVKSKGLPAKKDEVNRMFDSARMRHDKVATPYTALLQKDKAFTKTNFAAFFTKKEAFSKQWADYRKLLGR